jgi:hypothetical protein
VSTRSGAAPADITKTILDELQLCNPFNSLKHFFWYFIGIVLLMICGFCLLSVRAWKIKRQLLGLDIEMHWEPLRNRVRGDIGDQAWTLDWEITEFAKSPHSRSLQSLSYHIFPSSWCLDLCFHISLKNTTCCVCIPAPKAKLDKVPELLNARLMNTLDKVSCCLDGSRTDVL